MKTISYNLAKQIHDTAKEKGFELPDAEYVHLCIEGEQKILTKRSDLDFKIMTKACKKGDCFYMVLEACNTDELLEILPEILEFKEGIARLSLYKTKDKYTANYERWRDDYDREVVYYEHKEPYEALGNLYLYLIQNNLIPTS